MSIFEFMSDSPWLTFFIALIFCECLVKACSRVLRTINLCKNGWPPSHLDADGDFKPEPTND